MMPRTRRLGLGAALGGGLMVLALVGVGISCAPPATDESDTAIEARESDEGLALARSSADQLGRSLQQALGQQLEAGGPAEAIDVCSKIAPAMAREISRDGLEIRRVSERYRNPANAPDDWERVWLGRLAERHAAGELPKELFEVDESSGELLYLRPIVVAPQCLQCHGVADELDTEVLREVGLRYPDDRATGFAAGDLRGAFSVRVLPATGSTSD